MASNSNSQSKQSSVPTTQSPGNDYVNEAETVAQGQSSSPVSNLGCTNSVNQNEFESNTPCGKYHLLNRMSSTALTTMIVLVVHVLLWYG